ncbi:hypothetical protein DFJ74DRAFT_663108 [Hyaloraphidium curvatum]|nr:hypothetical protein DFJ74DRAFT_663108 [Hyaloraphidium curvatum]
MICAFHPAMISRSVRPKASSLSTRASCHAATHPAAPLSANAATAPEKYASRTVRVIQAVSKEEEAAERMDSPRRRRRAPGSGSGAGARRGRERTEQAGGSEGSASFGEVWEPPVGAPNSRMTFETTMARARWRRRESSPSTGGVGITKPRSSHVYPSPRGKKDSRARGKVRAQGLAQKAEAAATKGVHKARTRRSRVTMLCTQMSRARYHESAAHTSPAQPLRGQGHAGSPSVWATSSEGGPASSARYLRMAAAGRNEASGDSADVAALETAPPASAA